MIEDLFERSQSAMPTVTEDKDTIVVNEARVFFISTYL